MKKLFKIYNDGKHFVATSKDTQNKNRTSVKQEKTEEDLYFDELYLECIKLGMRKGDLRHYLVENMLKAYPSIADIYSFVEEHIESKIHNFHARMKRFKRKANLNKWNYFCTFTFDSKKMDAETFKRRIKKCLSNLHCRRNWRYMGVFELSPTEKRLHFHALMYIPDGEMVGELVEKTDYSTKRHCMQTTIQNTFFNKKFGRSDFEQLSEIDVKFGNALDYLTKYLSKSNDRIVYSRGIPTEIERFIDSSDIITTYDDFVLKYVLFDDIFDDNLHYIDYGQRLLFAS